MKSSPTNATQVECTEPPLSSSRQFLTDKFVFKVFQFPHHARLSHKLHILEEYICSSIYWRYKPPTCLIVSFRKQLAIQAAIYRSPILSIFNNSFESLSLSADVCYNIRVDKINIEANALFNFNNDENFLQMPQNGQMLQM